ncbi:MAG: hypothetical protein KGL44_05445 [Sphingomonadales bacterium]|nr:hypothetical protein [Sphingomonadales bacterium]
MVEVIQEWNPAGWQRRHKYPDWGACPPWEQCSAAEATGNFERLPGYEYRPIYTPATLSPTPEHQALFAPEADAVEALAIKPSGWVYEHQRTAQRILEQAPCGDLYTLDLGWTETALYDSSTIAALIEKARAEGRDEAIIVNSPLGITLEEVDRAVAKFPLWPTDPLHANGVLGEEFGELSKAVLQAVYEPHKSGKAQVRMEAIQTAAMALRFIASLDRYKYLPGEQHAQPVSAIRAGNGGEG